MSQTTLTSIGNTGASFAENTAERFASTTRPRSQLVHVNVFMPSSVQRQVRRPPEKRAQQVIGHHTAPATEVSTELVAQRLSAKVVLSALLAFGAGPLVAHGATMESSLPLALGLLCALLAVGLQIEGRRSARRALEGHALERGLAPEEAQEAARKQLRAWLS